MTALNADRIGLADASPAPGARDDYGTRSTTATFYWGQLLMIGADDGLIKPASGSAGGVAAHCCGVSAERTNSIIANPPTISYKAGIFNFANSTSSDALSDADRGKLCYAADDQTVAKTSNTGQRCIAGRVDRVDATQGVFVWVDGTLFPSGSTI